jgi:hypothetical protein
MNRHIIEAAPGPSANDGTEAALIGIERRAGSSGTGISSGKRPRNALEHPQMKLGSLELEKVDA